MNIANPIFKDKRQYYFVIFNDKNKSLRKHIKKKANFFEEGDEGSYSKFTYQRNEKVHFRESPIFSKPIGISTDSYVYEYGCFLLEDEKLAKSVVIAPFAQIIEDLFKNSKLHPLQHCVKVDLMELLDEVYIKDYLKGKVRLTITGVEISKSHGDLSNIMIKGRHPLHDDIGNLVYDLTKLESDKEQWFPSKCRLGIIFSSDRLEAKRSDISMMIDKLGVISFYMRSKYTSILFIKYFINFLEDNNFIKDDN